MVPVPTQNVRKMRWTYAAALQPGDFQRSEFDVAVSNWTVTGTNRLYSVSGLGSRRIEDDEATLTGSWTKEEGNYSGGSIHLSTTIGSMVTATYNAQSPHELYFGTRRTAFSGQIEIRVDGGPPLSYDLFVPAEDYLVRVPLGAQTAGPHTVTAELVASNPGGSQFFFDFVEAAVPAMSVDAQTSRPRETLATDWDTDHSLVLSPERVAWNMDMLGFHGRANHYVGAILFYELTNPGNTFASGTVTFAGEPALSDQVDVVIDGSLFRRLALTADTAESTAQSFAYLINNGSTGVWASVTGAVLTITSRLLGSAGNELTLTASSSGASLTATASGPTLTGGLDGAWLTDTAAPAPHQPGGARLASLVLRCARCARDRVYGGLQHGALARRSVGCRGDRATLPGQHRGLPQHGLPSRRTSRPPRSTTGSRCTWKWRNCRWRPGRFRTCSSARCSGGTSRSRFPPFSGMTFYDDYTTSTFQTQFGRPMHVFTSNTDSITGFDDEVSHLKGLIGAYCAAIRSFVLATYPQTKFEVLYPHDVNDFELTRAVNFPDGDWNPTISTCSRPRTFSTPATRG